MRKFLLTVGLLLLSAWVATWLRMLDPYLVMQSWTGLQRQPLRTWVGSILFYPLLELLYSWPAYIIGGFLFAALLRRVHKPTIWQTTLIGAAVGFGIYLVYASLTGEWLMRRHSLVYEQLLVYTLAGAFFGFCYNSFITTNTKLSPQSKE